MSHEDLVKKSAEFLNIATYRKNPEPAAPIIEPESVVKGRIDEAVSFLNKMGGYSVKQVEPTKLDTSIIRALDKYKQGRLTEGCEGACVYTGKAKTGVEYYINKKSGTDFTVSFKRPNGGKGEIATYPTFQGALYMLQSQVPSIIEIHNDESPVIGVSSSDVQPTDVVSISDFSGESQSSPVTESKDVVDHAIVHILEQIGVESLDQLDESTKEELLSVAREAAPYLV